MIQAYNMAITILYCWIRQNIYTYEHIYLWNIYVKWSESCSVVSDSLRPHRYTVLGILGQHAGVGSLSLLQGIFPTQGSNPGLPHCRRILYQLSHEGNSTILEWVAYPFFSGSSQPRNQTGVSCAAGRFCTNWAIREGLSYQGLSDSAHMQIRREMFP